MAPSLRIIFALLGVAMAMVLLSAALIFGALDRLALRSAETNVDFLLSQLRDSIESNVGLGLPLADIRIAQSLVERAKASDRHVLAVEVFSPSGVSLFNTDRGAVGEDIPAAWHVAIRNRMVDDRWRIEAPGEVVIGEVVRNDFGEAVGYLALTMTDEARRHHASVLLAALMSRLALVAPAVLAVVLVTALFLFGRMTRDVSELGSRLKGSRTGGAASPLADAADRVRATIDRAVRDFDRATEDVLKTDEA